MSLGIAGWPLRTLEVDEIAELLNDTPAGLVEIPKDLLDVVSIKKLFRLLNSSPKIVSLAGTTDFVNLAGLSWSDYRNYLSIQIASARFLGCTYWRIILGARDHDELRLALDRVDTVADRLTDLEIVIETHGQFESSQVGFEFCHSRLTLRFVVDFANIVDSELASDIARGGFGDKIAYFHIRNFDGYQEAQLVSELERQALLAYPQHTFLWEPKLVSGREAVKIFSRRAAG